MENPRPLSVKWGIGISVFLTLMFCLYAYFGMVSENYDGDIPGYNSTAYIILATLTAISTVGLIRSKIWSKWFTVLTLCIVSLSGIVSGTLLFMQNYAFLPYLVQPIVWGIPIFYLAFCIGWGLPSKSYFNNLKVHNQKLQRTSR